MNTDDVQHYIQKLMTFESEQPELYVVLTKFVDSDDLLFEESTFKEIVLSYKEKL